MDSSIWLREDSTVDRLFRSASDGFADRLGRTDLDQWELPTPCADWNVRQLVNHVTQGNLNYVRILDGAPAAEFIRMREVDALGSDPVAAFAASARACAEAYAAPGALDRVVDHPLGHLPARQALAVRTTDTAIHTWDLARAIGADEDLDPALVEWIWQHLQEIYAGMAESPVAPGSGRFYAAPVGPSDDDAPTQDRLLRLTGRNP
jgi:uncharacterized protein (TIGR03086 family)